jgi:hypothetical protein
VPGTRTLRFFPDYFADPLWDAETGAMISLDSLPLSDETRAAVRAWAARWQEDALAEVRDLPTDATVQRGLGREAAALCCRIAQELGPGWRVELSAYGGRNAVR